MKTTKLISGLSLLCVIASVGFAQTISTVAGNGSFGYSGDGGPATVAKLANPQGVAVDTLGNIYIADLVNNCVRKVDVGTGIINTFAGMCGSPGAYGGDGGPALMANLNSPYNLAFAGGNLYITEPNNNVVRKVDALGIITRIAGTGSACPYFSPCGDGGPAIAGLLSVPHGLAADNAGNVYIGDQFNACVRKVDTSGKITTIAGDPMHHTAANPNVNEGDGGLAHSSFLGSVDALALDGNGNLYIADDADQVIRKITAISGQISGNCVITRIAGAYGIQGYGGDNGPAAAAILAIPQGLASDPDPLANKVYISDRDNRRVRMISSAIITTFAGNGTVGYSGDGGPATAAQVKATYQLAVGPCNSLYIADGTANVIRKVTGTSPILNPSITAASPVCAGTNILATGHYSGSIPPDSYSWQLQSCTSSGIATSAYNSGVLNYSGIPSGAFSFPNTSNLPCNQYYLMSFTVKTTCPSPTTATATKIIYINCKPAPVISGNTTICYGSSTTLCANYQNNSQYTGEWTYHVGTMAMDVDAQCITVSPTANTTYNVAVTDNATGCRGNASVTVVVAKNNPDFTYQTNYTNPNPYFTVSATPVTPYTNGVAGFGDLWVIEQLDASGNSIPSANTSTGTSPNPSCWWIYPAANTFKGFDGTSSGINNVTCPNPSPGRFANGGTYRVTHGIWNNFCPWAQTSHIITVTGHRIAEKITSNSDAKAPDYSYLKPSSKMLQR